ncbi:MAG: helix-turn-helix domain-containing protein [Betaproteobacteria bacterium]|nr:helix-turn-helix domain-containing protein [Betaproteobacteria bacterium]
MPERSRRVTSPQDLGACIRAVRVAAGLRQMDAAELCGVSIPFLNRLELGKPTAQLDGVLKVCRGLGIAIELVPPEPLIEGARTSLKRGRKKVSTA